jgi:hypothetical protein
MLCDWFLLKAPLKYWDIFGQKEFWEFVFESFSKGGTRVDYPDI